MRVHLIAIGGSAMHNMALALHEKGFKVTGSDDEINEPSKTRLKNAGILPAEIGWFPEKITSDINAVILGMHAREDNPELIKAKELGLKVYSYPEYIYEATKDKTRVVIGGSHGKTTITAMILHVLHFNKMDADYLVGAQLEGFNTMVKLTKEAPIAIIEGDEYLASPIDRRPKFHLYNPNIAILSGIAWDHINVFPTFENYVSQFEKFVDLIEPNGSLIYCNEDAELQKVAANSGKMNNITKTPYSIPKHRIENGTTILRKLFPSLSRHRLARQPAGSAATLSSDSGRHARRRHELGRTRQTRRVAHPCVRQRRRVERAVRAGLAHSRAPGVAGDRVRAFSHRPGGLATAAALALARLGHGLRRVGPAAVSPLCASSEAWRTRTHRHRHWARRWSADGAPRWPHARHRCRRSR